MKNAIIENNYNQENTFMFTCFALKEPFDSFDSNQKNKLKL